MNDFIVKIWPYIYENLSEAHCFDRSEPKKDILATYGAIITELENKYGL
jgi:hypothetical protein